MLELEVNKALAWNALVIAARVTVFPVERWKISGDGKLGS